MGHVFVKIFGHERFETVHDRAVHWHDTQRGLKILVGECKKTLQSGVSGADDDQDVRLLSLLQFFIGPSINRTGLPEFVGRHHQALDQLALISRRLEVRAFFGRKETIDLLFELSAVRFVAFSGKAGWAHHGLPVGVASLRLRAFRAVAFEEQLGLEIPDQSLNLARHQKLTKAFEVERTDFVQRMVAVEVLYDEKVVERENEFFLAETAGVPEDDILLLSLFDGRKL